MRDKQYDQVRFDTSELEHRYGKNVHILSNPFLLTLLSRLCSPEFDQPWLNEYLTRIYTSLTEIVINREFPTCRATIPTRMREMHPEAAYSGPVIDPEIPSVSVNLARAGTLPSHIVYSTLNHFMNPKQVRQDHVSIARQTGNDGGVTGSQVSGHKLGGPVENAIVLYPDPMGATGSSMIEAIGLFQQYGKAKKHIALHCIVTPEYIRKVHTVYPDLIIYAVRLDRGLSTKEVLQTVPGTHWDQEKGLNHKHYIVPGGGGFGEVLNNAYV